MDFTRRVACTLCVFVAISCAEDDADQPTLPPADSMELAELPDPNNPNALIEIGGNLSNIGTARFWVGLVTLQINLALVSPRLIFAGTLTGEAQRDGDEWVWTKSYPVLGYDTELRGRLSEGTLNLELRATGTKPETEDTQDFLWFTGEHQATGGTWTFYELNSTDPGITAEWHRNSDTDKSVIFTNVSVGTDEYNDSIAYVLDGTDASFVVHDELDDMNEEAEFTVVWDTQSKAGRMDHTNGLECCWGDAASGLENLAACP